MNYNEINIYLRTFDYLCGMEDIKQISVREDDVINVLSNYFQYTKPSFYRNFDKLQPFNTFQDYNIQENDIIDSTLLRFEYSFSNLLVSEISGSGGGQNQIKLNLLLKKLRSKFDCEKYIDIVDQFQRIKELLRDNQVFINNDILTQRYNDYLQYDFNQIDPINSFINRVYNRNYDKINKILYNDNISFNNNNNNINSNSNSLVSSQPRTPLTQPQSNSQSSSFSNDYIDLDDESNNNNNIINDDDDDDILMGSQESVIKNAVIPKRSSILSNSSNTINNIMVSPKQSSGIEKSFNQSPIQNKTSLSLINDDSYLQSKKQNTTTTTTTTTSNLNKNKFIDLSPINENHINKKFKRNNSEPIINYINKIDKLNKSDIIEIKEIKNEIIDNNKNNNRKLKINFLPQLLKNESPLSQKFRMKARNIDWNGPVFSLQYSLLIGLKNLQTTSIKKATIEQITKVSQQYTNVFDLRDPEYTIQEKKPDYAVSVLLADKNLVEETESAIEDDKSEYYIKDLGYRYACVLEDFNNDFKEFCQKNSSIIKSDFKQNTISIIVDINEKFSQSILRNLTEMKQVSHGMVLPSGDFILVETASLNSRVIRKEEDLINCRMYPYLFERKTWKDLLASIKDGRSITQTLKMKSCKELKGLFYIIEGNEDNYENLTKNSGVAIEELKTYLDILTAYGFIVIKTQSIYDTSRVLSIIAKIISEDPIISKNTFQYQVFSNAVKDLVNSSHWANLVAKKGEDLDLLIKKLATDTPREYFELGLDQFREYIVSKSYRDTVNNQISKSKSPFNILVIHGFNKLNQLAIDNHSELLYSYLETRFNNKDVNSIQHSYRSGNLILADYLEPNTISYCLLELLIKHNLQFISNFTYSEKDNFKYFCKLSIQLSKIKQSYYDINFKSKLNLIFSNPISKYLNIKEKRKNLINNNNNNNNNDNDNYILL